MKQFFARFSMKFRASRITWLMAAAGMLAVQGCFPEHDAKTELRGALYVDSTLLAPLAGDTLVVHDQKLGKVGISLTDDSGHFAFSYWCNGVDANPDAKFQMSYPLVFLCYRGDTLWAGERHGKRDNIVIYPGINREKGVWYEK